MVVIKFVSKYIYVSPKSRQCLSEVQCAKGQMVYPKSTVFLECKNKCLTRHGLFQVQYHFMMFCPLFVYMIQIGSYMNVVCLLNNHSIHVIVHQNVLNGLPDTNILPKSVCKVQVWRFLGQKQSRKSVFQNNAISYQYNFLSTVAPGGDYWNALHPSVFLSFHLSVHHKFSECFSFIS